VHLFGYGSDLMRAELLYTSLLLQAVGVLMRTPVPYAESTAAFRRSWLAGFSSALGRRLRDAEARAQQEAQGDGRTAGAGGRPVALVLADRSAQVLDAVHAEYPRLRRGQPRSLSGSGGMSGWQAGQRAHLGGGSRIGGGAAGALSR
jgi:hypothetical protein